MLASSFGWHNANAPQTSVAECIDRAKQIGGVIAKALYWDTLKQFVNADLVVGVERYCYPSQPLKEADYLAQGIRRGAKFAVINAEELWESTDGVAMALLLQEFRRLCPGIEIYGCTDTRGNRTTLPYHHVMAAYVTAWFPMCFTPDTKVLTFDLQWAPLRDIQVGMSLLAFDEEGRGTKYRHWRPSTVTKRFEREALNVCEIDLADGTTLRATADHPVLARKNTSGKWRWMPIGEIRGWQMAKALDVWKAQDDYDAGYLAGVYDSDGCCSMLGEDESSSRGFQLSLTQNKGIVTETALSTLEAMGIDVSIYERRGNTFDIHQIVGGMRGALRFLGVVRPKRLMQNMQKSIGRFGMRSQPQEVLHISKPKAAIVVGIETSTHTYFAEGFAVHNCYPQAFGQTVQKAFQSALDGKEFYGLPVLPVIQTYGNVGAAMVAEQTAEVKRRKLPGCSAYTIPHATDDEWQAFVVGTMSQQEKEDDLSFKRWGHWLAHQPGTSKFRSYRIYMRESGPVKIMDVGAAEYRATAAAINMAVPEPMTLEDLKAIKSAPGTLEPDQA